MSKLSKLPLIFFPYRNLRHFHTRTHKIIKILPYKKLYQLDLQSYFFGLWHLRPHLCSLNNIIQTIRIFFFNGVTQAAEGRPIVVLLVPNSNSISAQHYLTHPCISLLQTIINKFAALVRLPSSKDKNLIVKVNVLQFLY